MVAGTIETAAVLLTAVFVPTLYYLFFGTIEVVCTSLIVWYAWIAERNREAELSLPASIVVEQFGSVSV
jgi:hypothetical protein